MTIKKINRSICKNLRANINEELKGLGEKHGLIVHAGNASYDDNSVTIKVTLSLVGYDKDEAAFKQLCTFYNLTPEDYGREFTANGHTYRLVGINSRSPKFCFLGERPDGKRFKFTDSILRQFDLKSPLSLVNQA